MKLTDMGQCLGPSGSRPNQVGPNPGRIRLGSGPFSNQIEIIGSDRVHPSRLHPQIDRKQVGCTPKSAQHGLDQTGSVQIRVGSVSGRARFQKTLKNQRDV